MYILSIYGWPPRAMRCRALLMARIVEGGSEADGVDDEKKLPVRTEVSKYERVIP